MMDMIRSTLKMESYYPCSEDEWFFMKRPISSWVKAMAKLEIPKVMVVKISSVF